LNFMGKDRELILVYSSMDSVRDMRDINVMVTPQFYTLKKEALPVKYAYQAKRVAPAIFDGLLEDSSEYEYMVFKDGDDDEWTLIAYNLNKIRSFLLSKGFVIDTISKLFFAQQVVDMFDRPVAIGDSEALVSLEGSVVVVPSVALSEDEKPSKIFDDSFTPKRGVGIKNASANSIISTKQSIIFSVIFIAFAIMFFVEGARYGSSSQAELKIAELYEAYPSLESSYTRDSIIKKYKSIDKIERRKRDIIKKISIMIFDGVSLASLNINLNGFKANIICKDAKVSKRVKALSLKEGFKTIQIANSNDMLIEGSL